MNSTLLVMVVAALVISLYTGFRVFLVLSRIRRESRKSFEIAERLQCSQRTVERRLQLIRKKWIREQTP